MNILKKSLLCLSLIGCYSVSNAAPWSQYHSNRAVTQGFAKSTTSIGADITRRTTAHVTNIANNTGKINEAIRVAVNQEAISTVQISDADKKARQVMANALLANEQAKEQIDVIMKFSPRTGQGYAACKVLAENQQLGTVMDSLEEQATAKVQELDNSPGVMAPSLQAALDRRKQVHNDNFCTDAEAEKNQCKVANGGETQGADSNANVLFVSSKSGSAISFAKQAVRQNILGTPNISVPSNVAKTAEGQAYFLAVNQKTALSAFPAYSLAYLESMSEIRDDVKDSSGKATSPNDMLFNTVSRYFGGKDSEEWQKSMIAQQPRGLLVEAAKMEALGAWMDYQELLANQRMEGNFAALTLTAALPLENRLEKQSQYVTRNTIMKNLNRD